jgi:hypothetical protein
LADVTLLSGIPLRQLHLSLAGSIQSNGGGPESYGGERENKSEQSDRISRRPLPKGFAFLTLVAGFLGLLVTLVLLSLCRTIGFQPTDDDDPSASGNHESESKLTSDPSGHLKIRRPPKYPPV